LYRLQHGELVNCPDYESPVIWVLIGTNDQSDHCSPESILIGILNIANYLQEQRPNARIVLNSILPKPNPTSREWTSQTNKYYDPVTWINQRLACYAQGAAPSVEYFDSSWLFVTPDDGLVPEDLMPDGLHPSGKGARIWGEAILKRVEEIVEEQQKAAAQVPES
jgi:lysophospholipase L1-like esterase